MSSLPMVGRALALASVFTLSSLAWADSFQDAWNDGMRALGQAKYEEACGHFSRAETISGASIKTRYQLGRCNEERGDYVSAHGYFLDAARLAEIEGNPKQSEVARKRLVDIEKRVPVIIVEVPPQNRRSGMKVKLGDNEIPVQNWGHPIAVEPGDYEVEISAPRMQTITLNVAAPGAGQRSQLVVPALVAGGPAPIAAPPPVGAPAPMPPAEGDEGVEMKRRNPALFWTGMSFIIAGGGAGLGGFAIAGSGDEEILPAAVGLWVGAAALIGVGIPFMVVFGKKVPVEGEEAPAEEKPAEEALRLETIVGPMGGALRLTF